MLHFGATIVTHLKGVQGLVEYFCILDRAVRFRDLDIDLVIGLIDNLRKGDRLRGIGRRIFQRICECRR